MKKNFFLLLLFLFFLTTTPTFATSEFETNYEVTYEILSEEKAKVTQNISLINKFSNIYATQYTLTLKERRIENFQAFDEFGPLNSKTEQKDDETIIVLKFNQPVVGKEKVLKFEITYLDLDAVQKKGSVLEINIPRLSQKDTINNYNLKLIIPKNIGEIAYIRPSPIEKETEETQTIFRFTKDQVSSWGITAAVGNIQVFNFTLLYFLENKNSFPEETEIPFPPDTAYQKVTYESVNPLPINVRVDNDGNWLAKYSLAPLQKLTVSLRGSAKIFSEPQRGFPPPKPDTIKNNLLPQKFWEVDHPTISQKANQLKNPREIYNFVIKTLEYDYERIKEKNIERMGAVNALTHPERAICMEFTDLFIALARAAGIPAREINGFAYTTNEKIRPIGINIDILHSWPEYYDEKEKLWKPVDPTWEKTTNGIDYFSGTDLNHFAFVIHGESSEKPYPPGSYRANEESNRAVHVVFGEYKKEEEPDLKVEFQFPSKIYWGMKSVGKIIVINKGPIAVYDLKIKINQKNLTSNLLNSLPPSLDILPPFSSLVFQGEIKPQGIKGNSGVIDVFLNKNQFTHSLKITFLPSKLILPAGGVFLLLVILFILTKIKFYARKK